MRAPPPLRPQGAVHLLRHGRPGAEGPRAAVHENDEFVVFAPWAPRSPFETWIVPKRHESNYEAEPKERLGLLAEALGTTLRRLGSALGKPAYNFIVHSNPLRDAPSPSYHWHLEVMPALTQVAGFEWGSGFHINPVPPEEAAEFLRKVPAEGASGFSHSEQGEPASSPTRKRRPLSSWTRRRLGPRRASLGRRTPVRWRILFVASEVAPWSKTGGLADVAGALPRALAARGHAVTVVTPRHAAIDPRARGAPAAPRRRAGAGRGHHALGEGRPVRDLLRRARALFGSRAGSTATAAATTPTTPSASPTSRARRWRSPARSGSGPRIVHVNDWQTGLVPFLLRHEHARDPALARRAHRLHHPQPRLPGRLPEGGGARARAPLGRVPLRGDGVLRPAHLPEGGAHLRRRAHHRLAHLRPRDPHAAGRRRPRRAPAPPRPGPDRHPERHRRARVGPATRPAPPRPLLGRGRSPARRRARRRSRRSWGCRSGRTCRSSAWSRGWPIRRASTSSRRRSPRCPRATCRSALLGAGEPDLRGGASRAAARDRPDRDGGPASASTRGWPTGSRRAPTCSSCRAASSRAG